jgi:hypothetical protein
MKAVEFGCLIGGAIVAFLTGLVGVHISEAFNPYLFSLFVILVVVSVWLLRTGFKSFRNWG